MQVTRTLKFKIQDPNESKKSSLNETVRQYRKCVNFYLHEIGRKQSTTKSDYQDQYQKAKSQYNLPTALIQQARDFAFEQHKSYKNNDKNKTFPHFNSFTPIDYDQRTLSLKPKDGHFWLWASLSTTRGRARVPIEGGEKHYEMLKQKDFDVKSAKLRYKPETDEYYLDVHVKKNVEIQDAESSKYYIGVDVGINNLATIVVQNRGGEVLETKFFDGSYVSEKRRHYRKKRKEYMLKGLWSKLRKSKGKERRFMKDVNHKISKYIKDLCEKYESSTVVMEKLDEIRDHMNFNKKQNRRLHNWNFAQLQQFIEYKAHIMGTSIRRVPPFKTSQVCRNCFNFLSRSSKNAVNAVCKTCKKGVVNADLNAAVNIVRRLWYYISENSDIDITVPQIESREFGSEDSRLESHQGGVKSEGDTAAVETPHELQLVPQLS